MNAEPAWRTPGAPALYRAMAFVWELARRTNPRRFPRGVFRYRSIEDMDAARQASLTDHMQALARQRRGR
jgi:hypothetical protein